MKKSILAWRRQDCTQNSGPLTFFRNTSQVAKARSQLGRGSLFAYHLSCTGTSRLLRDVFQLPQKFWNIKVPEDFPLQSKFQLRQICIFRGQVLLYAQQRWYRSGPISVFMEVSRSGCQTTSCNSQKKAETLDPHEGNLFLILSELSVPIPTPMTSEQ